MATNFSRTFSAAALAAVLSLGGCSAFDGDSRSDRDRDRDDAQLSRDVERSGSAAKRVPRDANLVQEGRGEQSFTARGDGEVYVADDTAGSVIWSGRVRDGDRVTLNPDDNKIAVNGKNQTDIDIKSSNRFKMYFLPTGSRR